MHRFPTFDPPVYWAGSVRGWAGRGALEIRYNRPICGIDGHASTDRVHDAVGPSRRYVRRRKPEWAVMQNLYILTAITGT